MTPADRYREGGYQPVCAVPHKRRLDAPGRKYAIGDESGGQWAVDVVCYDVDWDAFALEYEGRTRVYVEPKLALRVIRSVATPTSPDHEYAVWLTLHHARPWEEVVHAIQESVRP